MKNQKLLLTQIRDTWGCTSWWDLLKYNIVFLCICQIRELVLWALYYGKDVVFSPQNTTSKVCEDVTPLLHLREQVCQRCQWWPCDIPLVNTILLMPLREIVVLQWDYSSENKLIKSSANAMTLHVGSNCLLLVCPSSNTQTHPSSAMSSPSLSTFCNSLRATLVL